MVRSPRRVETALDFGAKTLHVEKLRHLTQGAPRQQLETGLRAIIAIAVIFARLNVVDQASDALVAGIDFNAGLGQPHQDIRPPRLIGDDDMPAIADDAGLDMLVSTRVFLYRGDV